MIQSNVGATIIHFNLVSSISKHTRLVSRLKGQMRNIRDELNTCLSARPKIVKRANSTARGRYSSVRPSKDIRQQLELLASIFWACGSAITSYYSSVDALIGPQISVGCRCGGCIVEVGLHWYLLAARLGSSGGAAASAGNAIHRSGRLLLGCGRCLLRRFKRFVQAAQHVRVGCLRATP